MSTTHTKNLNAFRSIGLICFVIGTNASAVEIATTYSESASFYNYSFAINNNDMAGFSVDKFELWVPYTITGPLSGVLSSASSVTGWTLAGSDTGGIDIGDTGEEYTRWESTGSSYDIGYGDILSGFEYSLSSSVYDINYPIRWKVSGQSDVCIGTPIGCAYFPFWQEGEISAVSGVDGDLPDLVTVGDPPTVGSVPEPSSIALIGLGLIAFGFARRRMV